MWGVGARGLQAAAHALRNAVGGGYMRGDVYMHTTHMYRTGSTGVV